jgi:hypothetical protein
MTLVSNSYNEDIMNANQSLPDRLLNEHETAEILQVKVSTLRSWRVKGSSLQFCRIGRSVRYAPQDLYDFVEAAKTSSTTATEV